MFLFIYTNSIGTQAEVCSQSQKKSICCNLKHSDKDKYLTFEYKILNVKYKTVNKVLTGHDFG